MKKLILAFLVIFASNSFAQARLGHCDMALYKSGKQIHDIVVTAPAMGHEKSTYWASVRSCQRVKKVCEEIALQLEKLEPKKFMSPYSCGGSGWKVMPTPKVQTVAIFNQDGTSEQIDIGKFKTAKDIPPLQSWIQSRWHQLRGTPESDQAAFR